MARLNPEDGFEVFDRSVELRGDQANLPKAEHLAALEDGFPFLDEGGRRFHMVLCLACSRMMHGF